MRVNAYVQIIYKIGLIIFRYNSRMNDNCDEKK